MSRQPNGGNGIIDKSFVEVTVVVGVVGGRGGAEGVGRVLR